MARLRYKNKAGEIKTIPQFTIGETTPVDDSLSFQSENPVQNKIITSELDKKVNKVNGKGLSTNDFTQEDKNKLDGLENYILPTATDTTLGGVIVDSRLINSSANPVQNKIVYQAIQNLKESLLKQAKLEAHPIGSYYWSSDNTNPSELFGGTWVQIKDKFILAAGDSYTAGSTGGSANAIVPYHNHTFTGTAESHTHQNGWRTSKAESDGAGLTISQSFLDRVAVEGMLNSSEYNGLTSSTLITPKGTIGYAGSSVNGANMPPYEVAYCWKRIKDIEIKDEL